MARLFSSLFAVILVRKHDKVYYKITEVLLALSLDKNCVCKHGRDVLDSGVLLRIFTAVFGLFLITIQLSYIVRIPIF